MLYTEQLIELLTEPVRIVNIWGSSSHYWRTQIMKSILNMLLQRY